MTANPKPLFVAVAAALNYRQLQPLGSVAFYYEHGFLRMAAHAMSLVRRGLTPQPPPNYVVLPR